LVDLFELYDDARTCETLNLKIHIFSPFIIVNFLRQQWIEKSLGAKCYWILQKRGQPCFFLYQDTGFSSWSGNNILWPPCQGSLFPLKVLWNITWNMKRFFHFKFYYGRWHGAKL